MIHVHDAMSHADMERVGLWGTHPVHLRMLLQGAERAVGVGALAVLVPFACIIDSTLRFGGEGVCREVGAWLPQWLFRVRVQDLRDARVLEALVVGWCELGYVPKAVLLMRYFADDKEAIAAASPCPYTCPQCSARFHGVDTAAAHIAAHLRAQAQVARLGSRSPSRILAYRVEHVRRHAVATTDVCLDPVVNAECMPDDDALCTVCGCVLHRDFDDDHGYWMWKGAVRIGTSALVHCECHCGSSMA